MNALSLTMDSKKLQELHTEHSCRLSRGAAWHVLEFPRNMLKGPGFCTVHRQGSTCMQTVAAATTPTVSPQPDEQAELERPRQALVGRLIAEAEEAECIAADRLDQLQQLQCAKRCTGRALQECTRCTPCLQ